MKFEPRENVRIGIIGVGGRGTGMLSNFLAIEHVQVNAICDVVKEKTLHAQSLVEKAGGKRPEPYNTESTTSKICANVTTWTLSTSPRRGIGMPRWP